MKHWRDSQLGALQWIRDAIADCRLLLYHVFVQLYHGSYLLQTYAKRTTAALHRQADAFALHAVVLGIRFLDQGHEQLRGARVAAHHTAARCNRAARSAAVQAAVFMVFTLAVFAFYGTLFAARARAALRAGLRQASALARRAGSFLQEHSLRWGAALRVQSARFCAWVPLSAPALRMLVPTLLFGLVIGLVFLRPTQAKSPDIPTPVVAGWSIVQQETPTPYQPVAWTPSPTATQTPTPTLTPAPSLTPTVHITAVTWFEGPGVCGRVDGLEGTGSFIWPSVEHRTGGFNFVPVYGHRGIDIGGNSGNDIYAADSGVVIYAGWHPGGYGNLLVLDHGNGYQTVYAHLTRWLVECGERVQQGDTIGLMGSTGYSFGPHLHFEVITTGREYLNPWLFVEMQPPDEP